MRPIIPCPSPAQKSNLDYLCGQICDIVQLKRKLEAGKDFSEILDLAEQMAAESETLSRSEAIRRENERNKNADDK